MPPEAIYGWAKGLGLPRQGRFMLYTGALYQLSPYIASLVDNLKSLLEGKAGGLLARVVKSLAKTIDVSKFLRPDSRVKEYVEGVLRSIAYLLRRSGVDFGYLYEGDLYSGVILYDLGLDDLLRRHARRVFKSLKERGVSRIITIDPHTTYMMKRVYPEIVEGYDLEVYNYLELISYVDRVSGGEIVIHDPCLYARFLGIIDRPRELLERTGLRVLEPPRSRAMTYCCGGPIEAIAPQLSRLISLERARELASVGSRAVTLCPICYINLSKAGRDTGLRVDDIAVVLGGGVDGPT